MCFLFLKKLSILTLTDLITWTVNHQITLWNHFKGVPQVLS